MTSDDDRADRAMAVLARGPRGGAWPSPQQLRHAARRRRMRRRYGLATMSVAAAAALAVTAAGVLSGPAAPGSRVRVAVAARLGSASELTANVGPVTGPADKAAAGAVAGTEQGFTVRLLQQVSRARAGQGVTVSPVSLAIALTMLENGARGATRSQIAATLGTTGLSLARQDRGWASLIAALARAGKADGVALQSANSLWLQKGLPMRPPFMARMARYFAAGVWQADFAGHLRAAEHAINQWVSQHTGGKITRLFGPHDLDQATLAVLANAVRFTAAWQTPFKASYRGAFHTAAGQATRVTFMARSAPHAAITPGYQAVQLPYRGGRFAATAIMPRHQTLQDFITGLTPGRLSHIIAAAQNARASARGARAPLQVNLPRFTTRSYLHLNQTLAAMGMPIAFTSAADFSAMSPAGLQVQSVVQRDYLSVAEKGTQAAAATGISVVPVSAQPTLTFDHPFLFIIQDTATGTILFASIVQNPAP